MRYLGAQDKPPEFRLELLNAASEVMFDEMVERLGLTPDAENAGEVSEW